MNYKSFKRIIASSIVVLLTVALLGGCAGDDRMKDLRDVRKEKVSYLPLRQGGALIPDAKDVANKKMAQENQHLALYYQEATANISVFDKRTGLWWNSNPEETGNAAAQSQLRVSTISSDGVAKLYTSYNDCATRGQVSYDVSNGLLVTYVFGNPTPDMSLVPNGLTLERYAELMKRAETAGQNTSLLRRRFSKSGDMYVRKTNLTAIHSKELQEWFVAIGYTEKEKKEDDKAVGIVLEEAYNNSFTIPLRYTLEGDSLQVRIEGDKILYPDNELITSLSILEYFGALKQKENGWFFIPDGSGALVNTEPQEGSTGTISLPLYGRDEAIPQNGYNPLGEDCLLPLFGISNVTGGLLAIIEDNEAIANINVVKPGFVDKYATVSAAFSLNAVQNIGLSSDSISKFYVTAESRYAGDIAMRYVFLQKEDADYVGMAGVYRDYLDLINERSRMTETGDLPFFLETVGAVKTKVSTLGYVHEKMVALTTFEDNITLIEMLKDKGISRIELILSNWMKDGENTKLSDMAEPESALGGKKGLAMLLKYASDNNVGLYPKIQFNTLAGEDSLMGLNKYSVRSLGGQKSVIAGYDLVTGRTTVEGQRYILSPVWQQSISKDILSRLKGLGFTAAGLTDISKTVYSDFNEANEVARQAARVQSESIIKSVADELSNKLMLTAPNEITAPYSTLYTDVPKSSSGLNLAYASIPFYQMVYHGYASYSFTAMNYDADYTRSLLKCAEYGGCPKFQFIYQEDSDVSFKDDAAYYASYYKEWLDTATSGYVFLNELLKPVQNARMTNHTMLAQEVYRTDYDNGVSIYVNYTSKNVVVDGVEIAAQSAVRKEGVK